MTQATSPTAGDEALERLVHHRVAVLKKLGDQRPTEQIEAAVRLDYEKRVQEHQSRMAQAW